MVSSLQRIGYTLLGILVGGLIMWMVDYSAYYPIFNELLTKCGEPCL